MTLYDIYPKYADRDFAFIIKAQERVRNYFIFDFNHDFLKHPIVNLDYDAGFHDEIVNIMNDDYYFTASGIVLLSKKVYEVLSHLDQNLTFYPCALKNQPSNIYALYKEIDIHSPYVIRNAEHSTTYYFSQLFINLIEEYHWNIHHYSIQ
ncbi:hypothetical protein [Acinetobacter sp. CFCC 10889]|uniref:hypothetical protein n=1 Tax=Acinetobacter sp. CFCC 10889 TaxID=1775557 RepID=UPI000DD02DC1|nr:hypothetical protein [Acinetobacter sp. CFCC 10889]